MLAVLIKLFKAPNNTSGVALRSTGLQKSGSSIANIITKSNIGK